MTLWVFYMVYLILTSSDKEDNSYSWVIMKDEKNKNRKNLCENYFDTNTNYSNTNSSKGNELFDKEKLSFEEISNKSIDHFKHIIRNRSKEKSIDLEDIVHDDNRKVIFNDLDLEKFNYYKHSYIKNMSTKIDLYESFAILFIKGMFKVLSKPWELLMDLFVTKSNEGFSLFLGFLIPMFFIWNFSELELYILSKVLSRLKVPPSFLGFTIMSWGNNAPDM